MNWVTVKLSEISDVEPKRANRGHSFRVISKHVPWPHFCAHCGHIREWASGRCTCTLIRPLARSGTSLPSISTAPSAGNIEGLLSSRQATALASGAGNRSWRLRDRMRRRRSIRRRGRPGFRLRCRNRIWMWWLRLDVVHEHDQEQYARRYFQHLPRFGSSPAQS